MTNQAKLQQQCDELKSQISAPQRALSVDSSPRVGPFLEALQDVGNQEDSVTHQQLQFKEQMATVSPNLLSSMKVTTSGHQKSKDKTPSLSLEKEKKYRRFQPPLHKTTEDLGKGITCGMEVGLVSPNSNMTVALGTIQTTNMNAKASDGKPLADCVEVLVNVVFNQMTLFPRAQGNILKLGSATARCIPWPRKNIICSDVTSLHSKVTDAISHISRSKKDNGTQSKSELTKLHNSSGTSQYLAGDKRTRKICKEKSMEEKFGRKSNKTKGNSSSQFAEEETRNYHISSSRC